MNKRIRKKRKEALHQAIISKLSVTPINSDGAIVIQFDMNKFDFDDMEILSEILGVINDSGIRAYAFDRSSYKSDVITLEDKKELIEFLEDQLRILKGE